MKGPILGNTPFTFGGNANASSIAAGVHTSFVLRSASGENSIFIPDANGTLAVSVTTPLTMDDMGRVELNFTQLESISCSIVGNLSDSALVAVYNNGSATQGRIINPKGSGVRLTSPVGNASSTIAEAGGLLGTTARAMLNLLSLIHECV
jgi:hypothetical protein